MIEIDFFHSEGDIAVAVTSSSVASALVLLPLSSKV